METEASPTCYDLKVILQPWLCAIGTAPRTPSTLHEACSLCAIRALITLPCSLRRLCLILFGIPRTWRCFRFSGCPVHVDQMDKRLSFVICKVGSWYLFAKLQVCGENHMSRASFIVVLRFPHSEGPSLGLMLFCGCLDKFLNKKPCIFILHWVPQIM